MLKKMLVVAALSILGTPGAFASDEARAAAREDIELSRCEKRSAPLKN